MFIDLPSHVTTATYDASESAVATGIVIVVYGPPLMDIPDDQAVVVNTTRHDLEPNLRLRVVVLSYEPRLRSAPTGRLAAGCKRYPVGFV